MPILETPPDSVQEVLRLPRSGQERGYTPEPRLTLKADLDQNGQFGERWLVVDQTHLRVLQESPRGPAKVEMDLPLSDIQEAKTESLVGSGALRLVLRDGQVREAVRYTLGAAPAFQAAARVLSAYVKEEEPSDSLLADFDKKKSCGKCGDPLPDDTNVCPKCVDRKAVLMRLLSYALPYKARVAIVVVLMLTGTYMTLLPMLLQKRLIDNILVAHQHSDQIGWIVLELIGAGLLGVGVTIWRGRLVTWMSNHMVHTIRTQAYDRLQSLSLGYYDKRQTGALMSRVTQDVGELQDFLVQGITFFLVNTLIIIGVLILLLRQDWRLTLLVLIPVPVVVVATRVLWRKLRSRFHRVWHLRSRLSASINSAISGVRVVKAFAQEARESDRFKTRSEALFSANVSVGQAWNTYFPVLSFVTTAGVFIVWFYGGHEVFVNTSNLARYGMTVGALNLFIQALGQLMGPIQQMTQIADWLSRSTAAAERVFEVVDAEPEIADAPDAVALPHMEGRVEMAGVWFSYDKNQSTLEDVSIVVEPGEMIGLVGHSGAGKSTIINLLSRFYDVKDGRILIDGVDIRKIKMEDMRRQIGVVLQEPFLFPGTISDNIAYAKPDATPIEIMQAAKAANAHEFVMRFPDGYDTYVGERGARLSGGERQRLSIARAILHDPRILILDEATASVDTETEKQIQEAMARLIEGRTTFAIAHRLSTLRNASRLMVMEKGKLVELGTHDELLNKPEGVFRRLVDMQQEVNKLKENFVEA
jgi:ATP-binding cassette subfamily B protein